MQSGDQLVFDILIRAWVAHDKNKLHRYLLRLRVLVAELLPSFTVFFFCVCLR